MNFDARALTDPVDKSAVKRFTATQGRASNSVAPATWLVFGCFGVIAVFILSIFGTSVVAGVFADGPSPQLVMFFGIFAVIITLGVTFAVRSARTSNTTSYRLSHFAQANNMTYLRTIKDPPLPGMLFQLGSNQMANQVVRGTRPRFVEFGNYQYTTGSGKNRSTHTWGYVAVKLDVPLPNVVLDAVGNNSLLGSNLPLTFNANQRLSLEGDFDRYFELYCPQGYERDALYLFTPDIMARFIDNAAQLDVEIVDDWLFLYAKSPVSTLDPARWAWLFGTVGALLNKFDQWSRWRDDRLLIERADAAASAPAIGAVGAPAALPFAVPGGILTPPMGVAHEGRRLKRGVSKAAIFGVIAIAVLFALQNFVFPLLAR